MSSYWLIVLYRIIDVMVGKMDVILIMVLTIYQQDRR